MNDCSTRDKSDELRKIPFVTVVCFLLLMNKELWAPLPT